MSQIEQEFRQFLSKNPELETCYQDGLINRRSLARYLIKQDIAKSNQLEAVIAMLRRFKFKEQKQTKDLFPLAEELIKSNDFTTSIIEIETIEKDGNYFVYEINPRSPAWIYAPCLLGLNLPRLVTS